MAPSKSGVPRARNSKFACHRKEGGSRHAAKHRPVRRGTKFTLAHEKEVAKVSLTDVAVEIQHERGGAWIDLLRLERSHCMVHLVDDLRLGLEALGWSPADRRRDQDTTFDILACEAVICDRHAEDRDRGGHRPSFAEAVHAAADHLPERAIITRVQQIFVALTPSPLVKPRSKIETLASLAGTKLPLT